MQLTEEEAKILDNIIELTLKNGVEYADTLPPLESSYGSNHRDVKASDYSYYVEILKEQGILEVNPLIGNGFQLKPITIKTKSFYDDGGYTFKVQKHLSEKSKQNTIKDIEEKKLKNEYRLSKWQVRTFWPIFFFGLCGFFLSIYNIKENRENVKDKKEQRITIRQLESELSTMRNLMLNQIQNDSLRVAKSDTQNKL